MKLNISIPVDVERNLTIPTTQVVKLPVKNRQNVLLVELLMGKSISVIILEKLKLEMQF